MLHTILFRNYYLKSYKFQNLLDEVLSSIDFLNREESYGENFDQSLILHHWKSTFSYRNSKTYINATEAINDWLPLQNLDGSVMVSVNWNQNNGKSNLCVAYVYQLEEQNKNKVETSGICGMFKFDFL